ncbi:MAG: hypothetical protein HWN68_03880 [Desulfobacterales bacterium]|nr:hypothetical protein [Desulfobacterales bacterium]
MIKKIILVSLAVTLMATPAFAGNRPEFDAVGCDAANYFNDFIRDRVVENGLDGFGRMINSWSDFRSIWPYESFSNTGGQPFPDPCFPEYLSSLADAYNQAVYTWKIILQMKPESDINLNIVDCVLKHDGADADIWTRAEQTGRYRAPWGQLFFVPLANPSVTVEAFPGPYATPGFSSAFVMDARTLPGLFAVPLIDALYTTKALWEEGIVMVLPETGTTNMEGDSVYNLKQGDAIRVRVTIPGNNTADIRYGDDNVILKYIGIMGTEYCSPWQCEYGVDTEL